MLISYKKIEVKSTNTVSFDDKKCAETVAIALPPGPASSSSLVPASPSCILSFSYPFVKIRNARMKFL